MARINTSMYLSGALVLMTFVLFYYIMRPIQTNYVSHSKEPEVGDKVQNNNPSCKHYQSIGTVTKINSLKGDSGKTITYKVENTGSTYCKGTLLTKTMDQLAPLH